MTTFRPSARIRLQVRLEEYDQTSVLEGRLQAPVMAGTQSLSATPDALSGPVADELARINQRLRTLVLQRGTLSAQEFAEQQGRLSAQRDRLQRKADAADPQASPDAVGGAPPDDLLVPFFMIPQSVSIQRNGIREADTCAIVIDHADMPIDPRIVRSCFVEAVIGTVQPEEFEAGIQGAKRNDGSPLSLVGRDAADGILNPSTRFVGWVDEWDITFDGDDGDTIKLMCRDMSALLIDKQLPRATRINTEIPIIDGISTLFAEIPGLEGLPIKLGRLGEDLGTGPIPGDAIPKVRKARRGRVSKRAKQADTRMSVWDHITDVTVALGLVPIFYGTELHLIEPRTFYASRDVPIRMVYGLNLSHLAFSRKLRGTRVPTIEVRSYDALIGRTRWARYPTRRGQPSNGIFGVTDPPPPYRASDPGVSGANPADQIQVYNVSGLNSSTAIANVAQSIFEQIGRQEIEGNLATADIDSAGVGEGEGDLLEMIAGDAVELLVKAPGEREGDATTTMQSIQSLSRQARADYLAGLGYRRQVADRLAALQDATAFQTVFRVQNVGLDWTADDGLDIKIDFINFITVRELSASINNRQTLEPPSPEVDALTLDRRSPADLALRDASSQRRTLTRDRQEGRITNDTYEASMEEATEAEKQRVRDLRGVQ